MGCFSERWRCFQTASDDDDNNNSVLTALMQQCRQQQTELQQYGLPYAAIRICVPMYPTDTRRLPR